MAATNSSGTGRKIYYNVSYGKLSTRSKEIPEGYTEMDEADLKAQTQKVQNVDLRSKYLEKGGDYPYAVFYDKLEGSIQSITKNVYDQGTSLQMEVLDVEGDNCIVQCKFYSKYTENILNRLCNAKDLRANFLFTPYAIPSEFTTDTGVDVKMYNQGIGLRTNGEKVEMKFAGKETGDMPATERVMNSEGKEQTSRVKRINYLYDLVMSRFDSQVETPKQDSKPETTGQVFEEDEDDLPF